MNNAKKGELVPLQPLILDRPIHEWAVLQLTVCPMLGEHTSQNKGPAIPSLFSTFSPFSIGRGQRYFRSAKGRLLLSLGNVGINPRVPSQEASWIPLKGNHQGMVVVDVSDSMHLRGFLGGGLHFSGPLQKKREKNSRRWQLALRSRLARRGLAPSRLKPKQVSFRALPPPLIQGPKHRISRTTFWQTQAYASGLRPLLSYVQS